MLKKLPIWPSEYIIIAKNAAKYILNQKEIRYPAQLLKMPLITVSGIFIDGFIRTYLAVHYGLGI